MGRSAATLALATLLQSAQETPPAPPPAADAEITPPRANYGAPEKVGRCYSRRARQSGSEGRTVVVLTIEADGSISQMKFAPGIETWQEETARCVIALATFTPGKIGQVAVTAEAQVPINFYLNSGSGKAPVLTLPKPKSTPAEVEDAYRACYPPDSLTIAEPQYRVSISARGKTTKFELVESSGDEAMDRAGLCMLERLKFEPARRDKQAVSSTVTMPISLRPPK